MGLATGTGGMKYLIPAYARELNKFKASGGKKHPVIMLADHDGDGKKVESVARQIKSSTLIDEDTWYVRDNLYLVLLPDIKGDTTTIEYLYDGSLLNKELGGKTLNLTNNKLKDGQYSKDSFVEKIIKPNQQKIDFSNFAIVLSRFESAIDHYGKLLEK